MRPPKLLACLALLGASGCPDDDPPEDLPMASGFAEDSDSPVDTTQGNDSAPTAGPEDSGEPWAGTAFEGDIRGVLTVTFTPAHPLANADAVGLAGGYRTAEVGWVGAEDLYSPVAYQLALPTPPEQADTILPAEAVGPYDWGDEEDWLTAGNGMKLRQGEDGPDLLACLLPTGDYPLYRSSEAMGVAPECVASPDAWAPAQGYDVVLYGGELFEDNVLLDRVTTPEALVVTAPDLEAFEAQVPVDQDWTISWEAGSDPEARVIIRIIDADTNVVTAHAADDGEFTIPAAELAGLTLGPIDLAIARERTDRVQFTAGGLTVLGRHERWGFFDLF